MTKKATDIIAQFPGIAIIHQKIPGHEVGRHSHNEHEFFLPLQGEITVQYKDQEDQNQTVKAGPGRMLYVPPNLDHSFSSSAQGSGERVICLMEPKLWLKHSGKKFTVTSLPSNSLAKELIFYLLIHQKVEGARYFIAALLETLLESLQGAQMRKSQIYVDHLEGKVIDERIRNSFILMRKNTADISITEIARESGLSQRNFNRLFMHETGLTPKDYLILLKVEKAKRLLKETRMTVTDISLEVGYNSLSKFIETFKKISGLLPSDYRERGSSL